MQVLFTPDLWVPLVNLHGVYILPGIPRLFKAMIEANTGPFKGPANSSRTLYTNTVEGDLAGKLYAARNSILLQLAVQCPLMRSCICQRNVNAAVVYGSCTGL